MQHLFRPVGWGDAPAYVPIAVMFTNLHIQYSRCMYTLYVCMYSVYSMYVLYAGLARTISATMAMVADWMARARTNQQPRSTDNKTENSLPRGAYSTFLPSHLHSTSTYSLLQFPSYIVNHQLSSALRFVAQ